MSDTPNKVESDRQLLQDAQEKGGFSVFAAFVKLSGPGWLQSAITLGGGSLAGALFLGVLGGTNFLWLQLVAIIMGVVMLSAISYVTLSTGEKPFRQINDHINPALGWGWLVATAMANMIWCMPQFSLCYASLEKNLLKGQLESSLDEKLMISAFFLFAAGVAVIMNSRQGLAAKIFDLFLKALIGTIVICFFGVVIIMAVNNELNWGEIFSGFIPDLSAWTKPSERIATLISESPESAQAFWKSKVVAQQRNVMIASAATAVGINMTFLLPYSMLARGWDKPFRGLARFDLSTGMAIPYILVTSCVVIAAGSQFYAEQPDEHLTSINPVINTQSKIYAGAYGNLKDRVIDDLGSDGYKTLYDEYENLHSLGGVDPKELPLKKKYIALFAEEYAMQKLLKPAEETEGLQQEILDLHTKYEAEKEAGFGKYAVSVLAEEIIDIPTAEFESSISKIKGYAPTTAMEIAELGAVEKQISMSLVKRTAFELSSSLAPLLGEKNANIVFGIGIFGMGFSTIIILMLINGYVFTEMIGAEQGGLPHVFGCLVAGVTGALWPYLWDGDSKIWLAILASSFGMMLLPIAYITFFLMMNSRSILKDQKPTGLSMIVWNVLMLVSVAGAIVAAGTALYDKVNSGSAMQQYVLVGIFAVYILLVIVGFFFKKPAAAVSSEEAA